MSSEKSLSIIAPQIATLELEESHAFWEIQSIHNRLTEISDVINGYLIEQLKHSPELSPHFNINGSDVLPYGSDILLYDSDNSSLRNPTLQIAKEVNLIQYMINAGFEKIEQLAKSIALPKKWQFKAKKTFPEQLQAASLHTLNHKTPPRPQLEQELLPALTEHETKKRGYDELAEIEKIHQLSLIEISQTIESTLETINKKIQELLESTERRIKGISEQENSYRKLHELKTKISQLPQPDPTGLSALLPLISRYIQQLEEFQNIPRAQRIREISLDEVTLQMTAQTLIEALKDCIEIHTLLTESNLLKPRNENSPTIAKELEKLKQIATEALHLRHYLMEHLSQDLDKLAFSFKLREFTDPFHAKVKEFSDQNQLVSELRTSLIRLEGQDPTKPQEIIKHAHWTSKELSRNSKNLPHPEHEQSQVLAYELSQAIANIPPNPHAPGSREPLLQLQAIARKIFRKTFKLYDLQIKTEIPFHYTNAENRNASIHERHKLVPVVAPPAYLEKMRHLYIKNNSTPEFQARASHFFSLYDTFSRFAYDLRSSGALGLLSNTEREALETTLKRFQYFLPEDSKITKTQTYCRSVISQLNNQPRDLNEDNPPFRGYFTSKRLKVKSFLDGYNQFLTTATHTLAHVILPNCAKFNYLANQIIEFIESLNSDISRIMTSINNTPKDRIPQEAVSRHLENLYTSIVTNNFLESTGFKTYSYITEIQTQLTQTLNTNEPIQKITAIFQTINQIIQFINNSPVFWEPKLEPNFPELETASQALTRLAVFSYNEQTNTYTYHHLNPQPISQPKQLT